MATEEKKDDTLRSVYDASKPQGTIANPDQQSVSRQAQYHTGTSNSQQNTTATSRTSVAELSPELQEQKAKEEAQQLSGVGAYRDPDTGEIKLRDDAKTIGDLLGMRKSAEQAERDAYWRKTASAVYQSFATLADIIGAAHGGNVYKREKDTNIADAKQEEEAKRDALQKAEMDAKEKDRQRLEKAALMAANISAHYDALRDKVTTNNSETKGQQESESIGLGNSETRTRIKERPIIDGSGSHRGGGGGGSSQNGTMMNVAVRCRDQNGNDTGHINFSADKMSAIAYGTNLVNSMLRMYADARTPDATKTRIAQDFRGAMGIDIKDYDTTKQTALTDDQLRNLINTGFATTDYGLDRDLNYLWRSSPEYQQKLADLMNSTKFQSADEQGRKEMIQKLNLNLQSRYKLSDKTFHLPTSSNANDTIPSTPGGA